MNYRKINNVTGWAVFGIATIVYFMTMEKSGSLWDCGEFASCCHKLGIPHPPGAPLFTLIGRIFSLIGQPLGMGPVGGVNLMSALASSFTILFLFWTITHFARKIVLGKGEGGNGGDINTPSGKSTIAIMISGAVGALAYTFSDSFWFSAVEAEVYAMSSLCTAVVFWAILKWEDHPGNTSDPANVNGRNQADKWLIFIFFMMGLSIGVHLLNLLTIPAVVLVYYFKRYKYTPGGLFVAFIISILMLGFVQKFVGQYSVALGFQFDKMFLNGFGLPVFTGFIFFYILLGVLIWLGLRWAEKNQRSLLRISLWCLAFTLIGMSTYMTTMIRSRANPGIDMYNVDNPHTLKGYLSREQYGDFPLLKGQHYDAQPTDYKKKGAKYVLRKENGKLKYVFAGYDRDNVYSADDEMIFPRMWDNNDPNHVEFYKMWLGKQDGDRPTMSDNFKWFFSYQLNWMYFRYFMWNFSGKQNDIQGLSSKRDGNWITGIGFLDNWRLGDQSALPDSLKNNKAHNKLFMLPLILGLIGLFYQFFAHRKDFLVTLLLFIMTGLAIVFYLNQAGPQPRERDYAYVGSFYAFAIWIGLGVLQVRAWFSRFIKDTSMATYAAGAICTLAVPVLMASQEWDDHNRGKKTLARDLAIDYLQSCPPNAMLFTIGDNDTYPLWYAQEVEGIRTDVRVVNTSLLGIDWYLDQLRYSVNDSKPFNMVWKPQDYEGPKMEYAFERSYNNISTKTLFPLDTMLMIAPRMGEEIDGIPRYFYPGKNLYVNVDVAKASKIFTSLSAGDTLDNRLIFSIDQSRNVLTKGDFGILNIIAANINDRPICFTDQNADIRALGLGGYFRREGMVYRLVPSRNMKTTETDSIPNKMMTIFRFGNAKTKGVYYDEENRRHLESIRDIYTEVAEAMVREGKTDKARELLQKVHKEMPSYSLPYGMPSRGGFNNLSSLRMAEVAFRAGDTALGKEIFAETEKDIQQELRYEYALSNPGANLSQKNVDQFISDFEAFMTVANQRGQNERAAALAEKLFKNKFSGFTQQDGYALMRNYGEAKRIRSLYIDRTMPLIPGLPGENPVQPITNTPAPPADTNKKPK